jgi:high-affinity nickel-transport protein
LLKLERRGYGPGSSTAIGMIHGVGAETGTQALLLASAAGATSPAAGSVLLLAFAIGLVMSNGLITVAASMGYIGAKARRSVQIALGLTIAAFSLTVGTLFLLQQGGGLPAFFS